MDFFQYQDQARRNTGLLVLLFVSAVLVLIAITNLLVALTLWGLEGYSLPLHQGAPSVWHYLNIERFLWISLVVGSTVLIAMLYKWRQLAGGGKRVAESVGGRLLALTTEQPEERQLLNVVEEMAIASGMPVPEVYVLEHELGINAFAAGHTPADAVIGVTRGSLERFDREQLQAVIAHEFSHILNGDMRLNLRLLALLHGILFIGYIGEVLLRGRYGAYASRRRSDGRVLLLGFGLVTVGWLGTFFGQLIKAAVSRQREFLADASAVQFTRNPQGIASALKVIGGHTRGTELISPESREMSHMFFAQSLGRIQRWFATHPPLVDRILRIEPEWDGSYIYARPSEQQRQEALQQAQQVKLQQQQDAERRKRNTATAVAASIMTGRAFDASALLLEGRAGAAELVLDAIPEALREQLRDPLTAMAVILALVLSDEAAQRQRQLGYLQQSPTAGLESAIERSSEALSSLARSYHLALIELSVPALKQLSKPQYQLFRQRLLLFMGADRQIDLYEWCLFQLLSHYLDAAFGLEKPARPRYAKPQQVSKACQQVLSCLIHFSGTEDTGAGMALSDGERAFNRGAGSLGLYNLRLLPEHACDLQSFKQGVNHLAASYPVLKARLLQAMELCIRQDGELTLIEGEMLTCIAAAIDAPIPDLGQFKKISGP